jgi:hypothetical protein
MSPHPGQHLLCRQPSGSMKVHGAVNNANKLLEIFAANKYT